MDNLHECSCIPIRLVYTLKLTDPSEWQGAIATPICQKIRLRSPLT
ncbi:hypothetical protein [Nostoc sp. FACHB-110]|nr:hypothetical protein [Nostoc sp. FACHB-110]MBD2440633.1 hypothetical protein [Nostoc sp. FACHB-110]